MAERHAAPQRVKAPPQGAIKVPTLTKGKLRVWGAIGVEVLLDETSWGLLQKRDVRAVLSGEASDDVVVVQFCEALHWRFLVFFGPERTAIYWNPYGTALPRRHGLHVERLAGFGWSRWVHSITHALQPRSDDYQCGVWAHVALDLFLRFMTEEAAPTVSGFE